MPDSGTSGFFVIYDEPFLVCLDALQCCLFVGSIREASWGHMDDVNIRSEDEKDIIVADEVCRAFEGASGTFPNMNPRLPSSAWAPGRSPRVASSVVAEDPADQSVWSYGDRKVCGHLPPLGTL